VIFINAKSQNKNLVENEYQLIKRLDKIEKAWRDKKKRLNFFIENN
tara:strand:- start:258 stop:395 length:138 start_codon:yes stop_codon:yes gene_type:complete